MGRKPGRPRKPTALKLVEGTNRKDRENPNEPMPEKTRPERRAELSENGIAEYERIVEILESMGVLTEVDGPALELYAETMAEYWEYKQTIIDEGATYKTTNKKGDTVIYKRPEVAMAAEARKFAFDILKEYGLTASSRSRVSSTPAKPKKNKFSQLGK